MRRLSTVVTAVFFLMAALLGWFLPLADFNVYDQISEGSQKDLDIKQINLTYVKQSQDALNAVDSGKANCAFILNPTRISEIAAVSSAGEKMPQKSTYFYPKLITGLVMNSLS